ncbi:MAG: flagellar biosynthetic protein FliR [Acidobacteriia bacterium]|nr:flagellar biosynthetic protein FliR [Terriglobia bacterium]
MERALLGWLAQVAPVALRVGGLLTLSPFFGDRAIPNLVKAGLLVALTALLVPVIPARPAPPGPVGWAQMALGEFLVGLLMGLSLQAVFEGMQFAGQISGIQLGLSLASLFDPQSNADSTALTVFYNLITLLIFLQLNVHHWVLRMLSRSFEYLPAGAMVATQLMSRQLVHVVGALFVLGIQVAAPVLLATMMIDLVLGFLSKASPQLPALLLGIPIKNLTGYALLIGAVSLWPGILERRFAFAIGAAERMLRLVH